MVTKRKPEKPNTGKDASATPACPSVAKAARPSVAKAAGEVKSVRPSVAKAAGEVKSVRPSAKKTAGEKKPVRRVAAKAAGEGKPARPSVAKAAGEAKPAQPAMAKAQQPLEAKAAGEAGAARPSVAKAADVARTDKQQKPKRRIAMPQSSANVKKRAAAQMGGQAPTKRFAVARAEAAAKEAAEKLAPAVEQADAAAAAQAVRGDVAEQAQERADSQSAMRPTARKGLAKGFKVTWQLVVACVVLAAVVAVVAVFSWDRWARFDDAADFQGAWYANASSQTVTIDGQKINLTSDVAYDYTLDAGAKTITFTFGSYEGHGRYRFSADRTELVITDGSNFSFWGTLFDDIGWKLGQAIDGIQGKEVAREAATDGVTVLDRTRTQS